jgi:ABC-type spermidine/putrescine transport system permease subunit I
MEQSLMVNLLPQLHTAYADATRKLRWNGFWLLRCAASFMRPYLVRVIAVCAGNITVGIVNGKMVIHNIGEKQRRGPLVKLNHV